MPNDTEARWLDSEAAARYISVRAEALPRLVRQRRIPKPDYSLGPRSPRWDRLKLDAMFDGGTASTDHRLAANAVAAAIIAEGRTRRRD